MTPDQLDSTLRSAIEADQRSVTALAKDAGVPQPSLHRYLSGERGLSWESARRLLAALGVRVSRPK